MDVSVAGFDWDAGNRAKCAKHGVSIVEVEGLFSRPLLILPDESHSKSEERLRAIGKTASGRSVFLVFTIRMRAGKRVIRAVSARYMHRKEVRHYEKENPDVQDR
ncbi:MAG: BrnT family toxin [Burkholderiales bacterium]|nr:BrnT family toxin [Burkholderiales bacterium]